MTGEARLDPVRAACIRTLYAQIPNSFAAAGVVTVYIVATAAPFFAAGRILTWLGLQLATQAYRVWLLRRFRRLGADDDAGLEAAAARNSGYMLLAGLVWGSTAFFFMDVGAPLTVALTMCGLYGISGGSVPGNAYNPGGLYRFIGAIFVAVMVRMLLIGDYGHIMLGIASLGFAGILTMFCRVQHRELVAGFAIRFENTRLLAALEVEKSEAEAARARAEQANLAKSQLLAAASHDLRQPLHALALFAESLQSLALDAAAKDVAQRIQTNVAAMETLFSGLLDISRLEAGVVEARRTPFDVQALFDRLAGYFEATAAARGLDLRFRDTASWATGDALLTEQICVNLIANALRYTATGGVLVTARRRGGAVAIEVYDTGIGIAAGDYERIFGDFVQIGNPQRDRDKGLGLGLAIAGRLARLQGSDIDLRSVPGQGSRFAVALPEAEPVAGAPRLAAAPDLTHGLAVLLIDDDAMVRDATALLLRQWGVTVGLAASVAEAEGLVATMRFDIVLADYRLPGDRDGLAVIAHLLGLPGEPQAACLVTGDMEPAILARAAAAGVPVMHKPLQPARLRALLNHLAATARAEPARAAAE